MNKKINFLILFSFCTNWVNSQEISINFSYEFTLPNTQICVDASAENFENIGSLQFEINWEANILTYDTLILVGLQNSLSNAIFSQSSSESLLFSWFTAQPEGISLPVDSILFQICFQTIGQIGDVATISISDENIPKEVGQINNGVPMLIPLNFAEGTIELIAPPNFEFTTNSPSCEEGTDGNLTIEVLPNDDLNYTIHFSSSVVTLINQAQIENLSANNHLIEIFIGNYLLLDTTIIINDGIGTPFTISSSSVYNCSTEEGNLSISIENGATPFEFTWNHNQNLNDSIANNLSEGNYSVTIIDSNGCNFDTTLSVQAVYPPIDLGGDATFCPEETAFLDAGDSANTYLWSTNETTQQIEVNTSNIYSVTITDENFCTASDEVELTFVETLQSEIIGADSVCVFENIILEAIGGNSFVWSTQDGEVVSENSFVELWIDEEMEIQLIASDDCSSDTVNHNIYLFPENFIFPNDTVVLENTNTTLIAAGGNNYTWFGNYEFSCLDCPTPSFIADSSRIILLEIVDQFGCSKEQQILVEVIDDIIKFFDPINVITPNNDGKNDFLVFEGLEKYPNNTLKIFNRWGNIIYETIDYQNNWGGEYKGRKLPAGTYYYVLRINSTEQVLKSILTISDK